MSNASSPIFVPSRSSSPVNSAGNTPYIVTSPPPDSPTSSEMALPHEQMIEHIARLLNIEEEEVRRQFPTNHSLLPIDRSPPTPAAVLTPDTDMVPTLSYPGTEFEHYNDPNFPNSPPISSPEPLPIPPPHFHDSVSITPPVTSATNSIYTSPVEEAFIEDLPSHSPSPVPSMAMVLYHRAQRQELDVEAMNAEAEEQTPGPNGPQPGVYPGPGWKDNFTTTGTRHFFVIPDGDEDVIAPFISYDLDATFPELLATNGRGCTVHSRPLHARAVGDHHSPISPKDELLLRKGTQYADLMDWALIKEDDVTLIGEVKYFRAHYEKSVQIACRIGTLKEALQAERAAMYLSSDRLAAANAITRLRRQIDRNNNSSPYFTGRRGRKARIAIRDRAIHAWGPNNGKTCDWCGKTGHNIEECRCLGYCRHCLRRGHDGPECIRPHDLCAEGDGCKVYPSHPNFERGYCAAEDDSIDV